MMHLLSILLEACVSAESHVRMRMHKMIQAYILTLTFRFRHTYSHSRLDSGIHTHTHV
jgi:hypothetical protein